MKDRILTQDKSVTLVMGLITAIQYIKKSSRELSEVLFHFCSYDFKYLLVTKVYHGFHMKYEFCIPDSVKLRKNKLSAMHFIICL